MNRYPWWKNLIVALVVVLGAIYALPNVFGEDPALQISAARGGEVDVVGQTRMEEALAAAGVTATSVEKEGGKLLVRFADTDAQLKANDYVSAALGIDYTVAMNLAPATPHWLRALGAQPMYLGLDLRGGVHFLLEVDTAAVARQSEERYVTDIKATLREARLHYRPFNRANAGGIRIRFDDAKIRDAARAEIEKQFADLAVESQGGADAPELAITIKPQALAESRKLAVQQNLTTLRNRINELGVAEPVIQQQGENRIVVQLPGVQDTARAKEILGGTATLEFHMVDQEHDIQAAVDGRVPPRSKLLKSRDGNPVLIKRDLMLTGDSIIDASSGIEQQNGSPAVFITLDGVGAQKFSRATKDQIGRPMAVVYIEQKTVTTREGDKVVRSKKQIEEVINVATIRDQLGKRFQITGLDSTTEARDLALLLRAGALAAPIEIVEERTIGPSLGAENIERGFRSTWYGFAAIAVFMSVYYLVFGLTAVVALGVNVVLLIALLSILQATLTLPGMAGIALTVGMAIDANVLINERVREELRNGNSPQASIAAGYERAFGTILDTNITTLIAGMALLLFGSGPVRGFAVVLCLGILTSIFSSIMVSRALVNLWYGSRRKLAGIAIGNTAWT
ncbi:MAG: protein translocase subunit SecD [Gammaproteobacteria bacterium]